MALSRILGVPVNRDSAKATSSASHIASISFLDLNVSSFVFNKKQANKFQAKVNNGVLALNRLIADYNNGDASEKPQKLTSILRLMDTLIYVLSKSRNPVLKSKVKDFRKNLKKSYIAMKDQRLVLKEESRQRELQSLPKTLAEFIHKMSNGEIQTLTDILMFNDNAADLKDKLKNFYPKDHVRKAAFDAFMDAHHIELLHSGNSKNFTVNKLGTTETEVLKVEFLSGDGNVAEMKLRERAELADLFTTHFVQKPIQFFHPKMGRKVTGNLVVTEFCTGSNVEAHGQDFNHDDEARLKGAADVFTQMSDVLMNVEAAGCAFPDMKATNWLLDSNGKLRVADGKSFIFTNAAGDIPLSTNCILSEYMCAPEQWERYQGVQHDISADKMHAYLLAKNLYHYLVRGDDYFLYDGNGIINNASQLDFSLPIFNTPVGQEYQALIQSTLKSRPDDRLSVSAFQAEISAVHASYKQEETAQSSINTSQDFKTRVLETRQEDKPDVDPAADETPKFQ